MVILPLLFGIAQAATVTITDPNCPAWLLGGTTAAQTLTCVTGGGTTPPPVTPPPVTPPPDPTSGDYAACSQYGSVVKQDLAFGASTISRDGPGFPAGTVYVGKFTVPAGYVPTKANGQVSVSEYGGAPTNRMLTVGTKPCDFTSYRQGSSPSMGYPLKPGVTYFVTVRNWSTDTNAATCNSVCDILVTVGK